MAGSILNAMRTVDRLMQAEQKHADLIEALSARQRRSEAREEILVAEAKAAAAAAASAVASQHISEVARRLGSLEERVRQLERGGGPPRLPPDGL